jgi:O-methyltransferase involved in polyketide biosynthesis
VTDEHDLHGLGLQGVTETALLSLYSRGTEAQRREGLIHDPLAAQLLASIDYPFEERFGQPDLFHVLRSLQFDQEVRRFLRDRPRATVVALGEGLETQLWRIDNGQVDWISVDLPEIILLRQRLLPQHPHNRLVSCSALDPAWTRSLDPSQGVLVLAQGLLTYFEEADVHAFLDLIVEHISGSQVVFDTIPAWAVTRTGHRQTSQYRMPPQPWGVSRGGVYRLRRRHPEIDELRFLATPRGRGLAWGFLYTAATRLPVIRGLLPMTVSLTSFPGRHPRRASASRPRVI